MTKNKQKKEILFYCPYIERGGISVTLLKYTKFLSKFYDISVFTNSFSNNILSKFNKKTRIINIKNKFFYQNRILNNLAVFRKMSKFTHKNCLIFSLQDHFLILLLNKFITKEKIVIRTSSIIPNNKNKLEEKYLKNLLLKKNLIKIYRLANKVITFSNENVRYFNSKKIKATCVYNYFEKNKIFTRKIKSNKLNFFFIGRLSYEKNPIFFLENLISLKNINIHFVGDGYQKKMLINIANKRKNIFFHGFVDNPFNKFKKKIDLLCITSHYEGTPNVMGEAMSYGIPVLAPKNIGLTNLFLKNGKYGFLYKNDNNLSFKKKIYEILNNYNLAKKKALLGFKSLERFNKQKTLTKLLSELQKI